MTNGGMALKSAISSAMAALQRHETGGIIAQLESWGVGLMAVVPLSC
jgi:hypothetical protein